VNSIVFQGGGVVYWQQEQYGEAESRWCVVTRGHTIRGGATNDRRRCLTPREFARPRFAIAANRSSGAPRTDRNAFAPASPWRSEAKLYRRNCGVERLGFVVELPADAQRPEVIRCGELNAVAELVRRFGDYEG